MFHDSSIGTDIFEHARAVPPTGALMVLTMVDQLYLRPPILLRDYFYGHQPMTMDAYAYTDAYQLQF
jgi:hypothetical protein